MIKELTDTEAEVFSLLANGWVANQTIKGEFRINNGPAQDMAIIERLAERGLVVKSSERAYVATVYFLRGMPGRDAGAPHAGCVRS